MIYDSAVQRVAPPRSIFADVALLRRELGEERCSSQEESSSSHAAVKSSQRACVHAYCLCSCGSISRHACVG